MAKAPAKELEAVDKEFREAQREFDAAEKRLAAASEARTDAHWLWEQSRSERARQLAQLSPAQWKQMRQYVSNGDAPALDADVQAPDAK